MRTAGVRGGGGESGGRVIASRTSRQLGDRPPLDLDKIIASSHHSGVRKPPPTTEKQNTQVVFTCLQKAQKKDPHYIIILPTVERWWGGGPLAARDVYRSHHHPTPGCPTLEHLPHRHPTIVMKLCITVCHDSVLSGPCRLDSLEENERPRSRGRGSSSERRGPPVRKPARSG